MRHCHDRYIYQTHKPTYTQWLSLKSNHIHWDPFHQIHTCVTVTTTDGAGFRLPCDDQGISRRRWERDEDSPWWRRSQVMIISTITVRKLRRGGGVFVHEQSLVKTLRFTQCWMRAGNMCKTQTHERLKRALISYDATILCHTVSDSCVIWNKRSF